MMNIFPEFFGEVHPGQMSTMSGKEGIGALSQSMKCHIEWKIENIFTFAAGYVFYTSPIFSVPGSKWRLGIYPNCERGSSLAEWISLSLYRADDLIMCPKRVHFKFGVKKTDGTLGLTTNNFCHVFKDSTTEYSCDKYLHKLTLQRKRRDLISADALTMICVLEVDGSFDWNLSIGLTKLSENFEDMLTSKKFCDATLKVKKYKFPVHKSVLTARCPVFSAMFEADMMEKNTGKVDIVDCDPDAFRDFLMYLYSGKFQNLSSNPFEVYKIADKYAVDGLKSDCAVFIGNNLTVKNIFDCAVFVDHFDEKELKKRIANFFIENFADIVSTAKWASFNRDNNALANQLLSNMAGNMKKKIKLESKQ